MQVLLDTNAFLWWVTDDPKLSQKARSLLANPEHTIFFSVVSAWEIIIKARIGKLSLPELPALYIPNRLEHYGFQTLTVQMSHVLQIWQLEAHHNDPFDRLLIAQSQVENLPIVTADTKFNLYDVEIIS